MTRHVFALYDERYRTHEDDARMITTRERLADALEKASSYKEDIVIVRFDLLEGVYLRNPKILN